MTSVWSELKRRNVVRVAVAYAVVAWLLIEVASTVLPTFDAPQWVLQTITFVIILGFPLALVFAWAFELTPEGIKREKDVNRAESITHRTGQKLNYAIMVLLVLAVGFLLLDKFVLNSDGSGEAAEKARDVLPNSVAVLLCDNLSTNPDDAVIAEGFHEEILNQLAKLGSLSPIARTSMLQYADNPPPVSQIAEELRVETVMECSVRFAGDEFVVTAQLIDPITSLHLWSETYPGKLSELGSVFAMQADIARNIANALKVQLSGQEQARLARIPTSSPEAYRLYLEARSAETPANTTLLIERYSQVIELDPEFADAYASRADQRIRRLSWGGAPEGTSEADEVRRARADIERALDLDPSLAAAYVARGGLEAQLRQRTAAQVALERAYALSPNDPEVLAVYAIWSPWVQDASNSRQLAERAVQLSPLTAAAHDGLGVVYWQEGDLENALVAYKNAQALGSDASVSIGLIETSLGNDVAALRAFREAEAGSALPPFQLGVLAHGYSQLNRLDDVERIVERLQKIDDESEVSAATWAMAYIALRDYARALEQIDIAIRERKVGDVFVLINFRYVLKNSPIESSDPRLDEIRERLSGF